MTRMWTSQLTDSLGMIAGAAPHGNLWGLLLASIAMGGEDLDDMKCLARELHLALKDLSQYNVCAPSP